MWITIFHLFWFYFRTIFLFLFGSFFLCGRLLDGYSKIKYQIFPSATLSMMLSRVLYVWLDNLHATIPKKEISFRTLNLSIWIHTKKEEIRSIKKFWVKNKHFWEGIGQTKPNQAKLWVFYNINNSFVVLSLMLYVCFMIWKGQWL